MISLGQTLARHLLVRQRRHHERLTGNDLKVRAYAGLTEG